MATSKKKKSASKAVSIWANASTRALYKRISKRAEKPFSEVVRVLVKRYDAVGRAPGLPRLAKVKKPAPKKKNPLMPAVLATPQEVLGA